MLTVYIRQSIDVNAPFYCVRQIAFRKYWLKRKHPSGFRWLISYIVHIPQRVRWLCGPLTSFYVLTEFISHSIYDSYTLWVKTEWALRFFFINQCRSTTLLDYNYVKWPFLAEVPVVTSCSPGAGRTACANLNSWATFCILTDNKWCIEARFSNSTCLCQNSIWVKSDLHHCVRKQRHPWLWGWI